MPLPIDIHQHQLVGAGAEVRSAMAVPDRFSHLVTGMGCWSLSMSLSTLLFEAPSGVLFEQHAQLYYAMLISLAVIGTVQIALGIFLQYRGASVLERLAKTSILTSSTMVLILTATMGGFSFTRKL
jgi:hypothetical protein